MRYAEAGLIFFYRFSTVEPNGALAPSAARRSPVRALGVRLDFFLIELVDLRNELIGVAGTDIEVLGNQPLLDADIRHTPPLRRHVLAPFHAWLELGEIEARIEDP